jgi:hypothetical protein
MVFEFGIMRYSAEHEKMPPPEDLGRILVNRSSDLPPVLTDWKESDTGKDGSPLDPWGTPYQFSYTSDGTVLIRSAGPDKKFNYGSMQDSDDYIGESNAVNSTKQLPSGH